MQFNPKEQGQGLVEYALLILLVAIAVIIGLALFGEGVSVLYTAIIEQI